MANGYRVENVANFRHLINVMYESLRPTNVLQDAANNTSLAPLDLGDGPAGTRVAGYNVTTLEALVPARRLHSAQQIRTANFVLQSADPSGINAAGPGSNVGQSIVYRFAGEILRRAWEQTRDRTLPRRAGTEGREAADSASRSTATTCRIASSFSSRRFPPNYVAMRGETRTPPRSLWARGRRQIVADEQATARHPEAGRRVGLHPAHCRQWRTWERHDDPKDIDPAPTALALTALAALGSR